MDQGRKTLTFSDNEMDGHEDQIMPHTQPLINVSARPIPDNEKRTVAHAAE